jgi:hypothetical protein
MADRLLRPAGLDSWLGSKVVTLPILPPFLFGKNFAMNVKAPFLLACVIALAYQNCANADLIYDAFNGLNQTTNSFTTTGSTPRNYMADELSTLATPNPNQDWLVDRLGIRVYVAGSGISGQSITYNNVTMHVHVYENWNNSAPAGSSVFTNEASNVIWNLGNVTNNSTTGGALAFTYNLDYAANGLDFILDNGQNMGIAVEFLVGGVANNSIALLLRSVAGDPGLPAIGTSPNGWYRDANANGIIEASDRRVFTGTNSNAHFQIFATAIPEPSAFALLSVVLTGVHMRRRSK